MNKILRRSAPRQNGFTILELLIATLVFSVVLLLVTTGIMQITRVYYKGVTEANTQNTARAIMDTVSQAIQFSGSDIVPTPTPQPNANQFFCIGNEQFAYRLGWQVKNHHDNTQNQTWHGLVQNTVAGAGCTAPSGVPDLTQQNISGRDLVGEHMRLSNLVVESLGQHTYRVRVKVVYGDNDVLNNPTAANATCKGQQQGTAFCAVSELSTIVVKRVR